MPGFKAVLRKALRSFDLDVVRRSRLSALELNERAAANFEFLCEVGGGRQAELVSALQHSQAQLRQDVFVLNQLGFRRGGFFVEFGATDGKTLSNTWLLEKHYGWTGILAEPAHCWRDRLLQERSAVIDFDCVWSASGEQLDFLETDYAELSTLVTHADGDSHARSREARRSYPVRTVSLNDLLARHAAPREIDYLSLDTEGSEFEILSNFDFGSYRVKVITCEHNYTPNRDRLFQLLEAQGYCRVHPELSKFDDWYVRKDQ